jgi:hypothetical protein
MPPHRSTDSPANHRQDSGHRANPHPVPNRHARPYLPAQYHHVTPPDPPSGPATELE